MENNVNRLYTDFRRALQSYLENFATHVGARHAVGSRTHKHIPNYLGPSGRRPSPEGGKQNSPGALALGAIRKRSPALNGRQS